MNVSLALSLSTWWTGGGLFWYCSDGRREEFRNWDLRARFNNYFLPDWENYKCSGGETERSNLCPPNHPSTRPLQTPHTDSQSNRTRSPAQLPLLKPGHLFFFQAKHRKMMNFGTDSGRPRSKTTTRNSRIHQRGRIKFEILLQKLMKDVVVAKWTEKNYNNGFSGARYGERKRERVGAQELPNSPINQEDERLVTWFFETCFNWMKRVKPFVLCDFN